MAEADRLVGAAQHEAAVQLLERAACAAQAAADPVAEADSLLELGLLCSKPPISDYERAVSALRRTVELYGSKSPELASMAATGRLSFAFAALGRAHEQSGDSEAAIVAYDNAALSAKQIGRPAGELGARAMAGRLLLQVGRAEDSLDFFEHCAEIAESLSDAGALARAYINTADALACLNRLVPAVQALATAERLARDGRDDLALLRTHIKRANVHFKLGEIEAALRDSVLAERLAEARGDAEALAHTLSAQGRAHHRMGNLDEALRVFDNARGVASRAGCTSGVAAAALGTGRVLMQLERYRDAVQLITEAEVAWEKLGDSAGRGLALQALGAALVSHDKSAALRAFRRAADCFEDASSRFELAELACAIAEVHYASSCFDEALAAYRNGLALAIEVGDRLNVARAHFGQAEVCFQMRRMDEAETSLDQAEAGYRSLKDELGIGNVMLLRGEIAGRRGNYEGKLAATKQALEHYRRCGSKFGLKSAMMELFDACMALGRRGEAIKWSEECKQVGGTGPSR